MLELPQEGEIGIDESGRGTLWGNVVAATVILPSEYAPWMERLNDSKKLSAKSRAALVISIKEHAIAWSIGEASPQEIDDTNILRATITAMHRAIDGLGTARDTAKVISVDGTYFIKYQSLNYNCIPGGDAKRMSIAAASILAKEHRDASVLADCASDTDLKTKYFMDRHKGYGTKLHMESLKIHGAHPKHRKTFAPVAAVIII